MSERPKSPGCRQVILISGNARSATRVHFFVRRRFVMVTCSPSTVGEPLPQQVTNVTE
jgi:hypothetical protein